MQDGVPAIFHAVAKHKHFIVPVGFLLLIGVLVIPLPPFMMDLMLCGNIAIAAVVLMTTMYMRRPLDFSVFPALLLGTTLFRLESCLSFSSSCNSSSSRRVQRA